jgi:hypothetical protein
MYMTNESALWNIPLIDSNTWICNGGLVSSPKKSTKIRAGRKARRSQGEQKQWIRLCISDKQTYWTFGSRKCNLYIEPGIQTKGSIFTQSWIQMVNTWSNRKVSWKHVLLGHPAIGPDPRVTFFLCRCNIGDRSIAAPFGLSQPLIIGRHAPRHVPTKLAF